MTPSTVVEATADFARRLGDIAGIVAAAVKAGGQTVAQLEAIRATAAGLEGDLRATLRDLDRRDEIDWLVVADGERCLAIWTWRRDTRRALLGLWARAHAIALVAGDLAGGTRQQVVVVREGETWQSIAQRELGGWQEWPRLLAANPTVPPGALASGTTLVVPEKR